MTLTRPSDGALNPAIADKVDLLLPEDRQLGNTTVYVTFYYTQELHEKLGQ